MLPSFLAEPNPEIYLSDNYVVLDCETTNIEHGSALAPANHLLLACWRVGPNHAERGKGSDYSAWADEFGQSRLLNACASADFLVAHHSKFELGWLKRCGVDLRTVLTYDTMVGEKVIAGNKRAELSLEATAARRGLGTKAKVVALLIAAGVSPTEIPTAMLEAYCAQDVALTESLFLAQRRELQELALLPVHFVRNVVTPCLADIEFNGMVLDPERVKETYAEYAEKYGALAEQFAELTGGINVKSPKQMAAFLYETLGFEELTDHKGKVQRTETNSPKTDKLTLAKLTGETSEQRKFLKVARELVKLKTPLQNLTKMHKTVTESPNDPRVFAIYNQTVTQTHRLSSSGRRSGFQFHNFDRAFKKLFRARKDGWLMVEGDAPQLEFRVAAYLGHDEAAKADIQEGVDVHAITAATLGVERQDAKPFTFKPLYGGRSGTPRQRKYYEYFNSRYRGISRTQSGWAMGVARDKLLVTPWGLRFYWPDAELKEGGYVTQTPQIYNYPIQSFATADIIPLVLVLVWHRLAELGDSALLVNTIHDSIVAEVAPEARSAYEAILVESFTEDVYALVEQVYGMQIDVPLGVGIKVSEFWADTKEEKKVESRFFEQKSSKNTGRV